MKIPPLTHTHSSCAYPLDTKQKIKLNKYVKRNGTVDTQIPRKKSRRRRMSRIPFYFVAIQTVWTNNTHCPVWISRSQILWCLLLVGRATAAASTNGKRYTTIVLYTSTCTTSTIRLSVVACQFVYIVWWCGIRLMRIRLPYPRSKFPKADADTFQVLALSSIRVAYHVVVYRLPRVPCSIWICRLWCDSV